MIENKFLLVDGFSMINRAFYAISGRNALTTSEGMQTNAIFGFINILNRYLEEEKPNYLCVAFDVKKPTFRHKEYSDYKGTRKKMPDELASQIPYIKQVLEAMRVKITEMEGFEADDIIGTLATKAAQLGVKVVILSGDRDLLQIAQNNVRVRIPVTKAGKSETEEYDVSAIKEKYLLTPKQLIDLKALMGDTSDNIPGVKGVGEKSALPLVQKYFSLDGIYENIEEISGSLKIKLSEHKDEAYLSKMLATIICDIPLEFQMDDYSRNEIDKETLLQIFKQLQFNSLIEKYSLSTESNNTHKTLDITIEQINSIQNLKQLKEKINQSGFISIVTQYINKQKITIGLFPGGDKSFYMELDLMNDFEILNTLLEIFNDDKTVKYIYDLKKAIEQTKRYGISYSNGLYDTFVSAYVLDTNGQKYKLNELARQYLDIEIQDIDNIKENENIKNVDKIKDVDNIMNIDNVKNTDIPKSIQDNSQAQKELIAGYAYINSLLGEVFKQKIVENNQEYLLNEIEMPLPKILEEMQTCGFKIDIPALKEYGEGLTKEITSIQQEIYCMAGETFNIGSPKQLAHILFDKLALPANKKNKSGFSTDIEVLEELSEKHEIVRKIILYRQYMKINNTYVESLLNIVEPIESKVHTKFNQTGTVTGRITSIEPNLQNIPFRLEIGRKIRKVFVPTDKDYVLIDADYSQIELRVLAHITGDENLVKAFNEGADIHSITASKIFKVPQSEVTSIQRGRAKAVNFGIIYGLGEFSLAKDLGVTRKEAKQYIEEYLGQYPKVREYMTNIVIEAKEKGYVSTIFNRRRNIPEINSKNFVQKSFGERIALNAPIQGTAADIMKLAMVRVYNELKSRKLKSKLILQVHDEILIDAKIDEAQVVKEIVMRNMQQACTLKVPLLAEVKEGKNWYESK